MWKSWNFKFAYLTLSRDFTYKFPFFLAESGNLKVKQLYLFVKSRLVIVDNFFVKNAVKMIMIIRDGVACWITFN